VNNITTAEFTTAVLDTYIVIEWDKQEDAKEVKLPVPFDPNNYNLFETSLNSYLDIKLSQEGDPLSYFLCNDPLHPASTA